MPTLKTIVTIRHGSIGFRRELDIILSTIREMVNWCYFYHGGVTAYTNIILYLLCTRCFCLH